MMRILPPAQHYVAFPFKGSTVYHYRPEVEYKDGRIQFCSIQGSVPANARIIGVKFTGFVNQLAPTIENLQQLHPLYAWPGKHPEQVIRSIRIRRKNIRYVNTVTTVYGNAYATVDFTPLGVYHKNGIVCRFQRCHVSSGGVGVANGGRW